MANNEPRGKTVTLTAGCAVSSDMLYVSGSPDAVPDDVAYTRLFVFNMNSPEKWGYHDIPDENIVSVAFRPATAERSRACYALSENGMVETYSSTEHYFERIEGAGLENGIETRGALQKIRHIGASAYACGAGNQIYRREREWSPIDHEIKGEALSAIHDVVDAIVAAPASESGLQVDYVAMTNRLRQFTMLDDIAGLREDDVYSCGSNGVIWHWNGSAWNKCSSGTRQHLHSIHCVSASEVIVCGHNGTIVAGNHRDGFRRLMVGQTDRHLWSVRKFGDDIYIGTSQGLMRVREGALDEFRPDSLQLPFRFSVADLDSTEGVLWVIADRFVLRFDGNDWQLITHPDNE